MKIAQTKVAILVPAHNEEVVLSATLSAALELVDKKDIYVVNDGSADNTRHIAELYTKNVLNLNSNLGKAGSLNIAIAYFQLTQKYKYIFPVDADTQVDKKFLENALKTLEKDTKEKYVCVTGQVIANPHNWLTSYRLWEYEVTQRINKAAQEKEGAIIVCSGCSTVYRSSLFTKVQFPSDTVTEDMDLTFMIHRKKLGKIAYASGAQVRTQDPSTLKDYVGQITRWYRGYWQCIKKHQVPWGFTMFDFELALASIEGISSGLLVLFTLLTFPLIIQKQWTFLAIPFAIDFLVFFLPTVYMTMFIHSNLKMIIYLPHFYFLRALNGLIFLYSFAESVFSFKNITNWGKISRYQLKGV